MPHIDTPRSANTRIGLELSNGQREHTLDDLAADIADRESHPSIEHECCGDMQSTIAGMRDRVAARRLRASGAPAASGPEQSPDSA
jgi:hypothetical protein